jgi:polyhydroxyalkanoate synthase subunit PhaC
LTQVNVAGAQLPIVARTIKAQRRGAPVTSDNVVQLSAPAALPPGPEAGVARRRPPPLAPFVVPDIPEADEVETARAETLDRMMHAWQARFTRSISPAALSLAYLDWAMHLANSPGKQAILRPSC